VVVRIDSALELKRRLTERAHTAAAAEPRVAAVLVHGGGGDDRQTLASARAEFARVAQAFEHGARFYECACHTRAIRVPYQRRSHAPRAWRGSARGSPAHASAAGWAVLGVLSGAATSGRQPYPTVRRGPLQVRADCGGARGRAGPGCVGLC
jgi:hypothetical protein